jgi:phosphate-selective porin OprO/OprP
MNQAIFRGLALSACMVGTLPDAQAQDTEKSLRELIDLQAAQLGEQQRQIEILKSRLNALETASPATNANAHAQVPAQARPLAVEAMPPPQPSQTGKPQELGDDSLIDEDLAILQAQVAQMAVQQEGAAGRVRWNRPGPEFVSPDGQYTFRPRGRVMLDFSATHGSDYAARNITGTDLAAGRLGAEGSIGPIGYRMDVELLNNEVSFKELNLSYGTRIAGQPTAFFLGNKLKDRSIDGASGNMNTPFMERGAVSSVGGMYSGFFGLGITAKTYGRNWHASLSVTGDDVGNDSEASDTIAYLTRMHWNPIVTSQGFIHLGGWYWYEDLARDVESINKTSPLALGWNREVLVSASSIDDPTDNQAWGAELGGVWGSAWSFAEVTTRTLNSSSEPSRDQKAYNISAGWLLTGERPGFARRSGVWGSTNVLQPVTAGGKGAWELAVRYDNYDFTDAPRGGDGEAWTLGLNWYLTRWSRVMLNLVHWKTDNLVGSYRGEDSGNTVGARAQVVF